MARTVVGLFDNAEKAQNAIHKLLNMGVPRDNISLVTRDIRGEYAAYAGQQALEEEEVAQGAKTGAVGGGVLGGLLGLLIGVGVLTLPGLGALVAAGPLAAAIGSGATGTLIGAGMGAISGGLLGALIDLGLPEDEANAYAEGVRRGGILVAASVNDELADRVYTQMQHHGAVDMEERVSQWRADGWQRFETEEDIDTGQPGGPESTSTEEEWAQSDKMGTATGTAAGAVAGAAAGAAAGPPGAVVGGVAGAAIGAAAGAAADISEEYTEPPDEERREEAEEEKGGDTRRGNRKPE